MRVHGTLTKWDDARGFGFIARDQRDEQVFVHISAFPRGGIRPQIGETLSFEIDPSAKGRPRAVAIQRADTRRALREPPVTQRRTRVGALAVVCAAIVGVYSYVEFGEHRVGGEDLSASPATVSPHAHRSSTGVPFACDGRKYCSQMTSCAEATWFLQHCPNVQMDGDHDGVPCEQQWCSQ